MSIFKLPDLGEGLQDAEIREWHVSVGDEVKVDQLLVSVETGKAVVDIPSPQSGRIEKLNGEPGDILQVGAPLVEFEGGEAEPTDKGTVVGRVEVGQEVVEAQGPILGAFITRRQGPGINFEKVRGGGEEGPNGDGHDVINNQVGKNK